MSAVAPPHPSLVALLRDVRRCRACEPQLPHGARPVLQAAGSARILVVGQAPSARVHASGIPWDDASGARLRGWLGIDAATFHDASRIALVPMAFCYPGRGASGDLPPPKRCAERWHARVLARLPRIELTLLVGAHAQRRFLGTRASLTATTKGWRDHAPRVWPLVHPSPRNTAWFQANRWFDEELVPALREQVAAVLRR
jgi:uracil-DNA glycosylase